jgi:thioredoxin 1
MQKTVLEVSVKTLLAFLTTALILMTAPAMAGERPYDAATLDRMLAAGQPVVVDFHADWCPTCRAQAPIVKDLLSTPELKNLTVLIADYDTEHALRKSLNVANQSTFVVFRQGKEVARSTGDTSREGLAKLFKKAIS